MCIRDSGDTTHRAEEARFHLRLKGDAKLAVALATENYRVQKEPRDARILLEAAVAAQDPGAARAVLDWLQTSGFEDALLRQLGEQLTQAALADPARKRVQGRFALSCSSPCFACTVPCGRTRPVTATW